MSNTQDPVDHVIMDRYGTVECLHCGGSYRPGPMPLSEFLTELRRMADDHADCKPPPPKVADGGQ